MIARCLWLILLLPACHEKPAATPAPGAAGPPPASAAQAAPAPESVLKDPHRFDCAADADCMNSCRYGAVNSAWYLRAMKAPGYAECEDGCDNQISAAPRCEGGGCVATQRDPQDESKITPRPSCTRVER